MVVTCTHSAPYPSHERFKVGRSVLVFVLTLCLGTFVLSPDAKADPPSRQDVREAKRAYSSAKRSLRKKDIIMALVHLKDAENKHPSYKYAALLARTHLQSNQPVIAWEAANRAERYGIPKQKQRAFEALFAEIEDRLKEGHAFLELSVFPPNASVRIGKQQWLPPYRKWVPRSFSVLELEAPGHAPMSFKWHHPTGNRANRTVRMEPTSNFGRIEVSGAPKGASVSIDGKRIGKLPSATSGLLKPGNYNVTIERADFITMERQVTVTKGTKTPLEIMMDPTESDLMKALKSKTVWGWTSVGVGGAAFITGIGLLAHSAVLINDVETLNRTHISGYEKYLIEYDKKAADIPTFGAAGWSMLVVGLALGATGATLLVLEHQEKEQASNDMPESAQPSPVTVRIAPAPMGASATVRF